MPLKIILLLLTEMVSLRGVNKVQRSEERRVGKECIKKGKHFPCKLKCSIPCIIKRIQKSLGLVKVQANTSCKQFKLIEIAHWLT